MNSKQSLKDIYFFDTMKDDHEWEYNKILADLEALEILRNKKVNLEYLKCCENYEQYKNICSYWNEITKQEFDLLKEVLL